MPETRIEDAREEALLRLRGRRRTLRVLGRLNRAVLIAAAQNPERLVMGLPASVLLREIEEARLALAARVLLDRAFLARRREEEG